MAVVFLTIDQALEIHQDQIKRYGGTEEIRDYGLLESAIFQAQSSYDKKYLHTTIFEMAVAYAFHIISNHPFIDGNKRVGITCSLVFLLLNEYSCESSNEDLENLVLEVAEGKKGKQDITAWLKQNCIKI